MTIARLVLLAACLYVTCGVAYEMACVDQVRPAMDAVDEQIAEGDLPHIARPIVAMLLFAFFLVVWPVSVAFDLYLKLRRRS